MQFVLLQLQLLVHKKSWRRPSRKATSVVTSRKF